MKTFEEIRLVVRSSDWANELRRIYPQGFISKADFRCYLAEDDPKLAEIKSLLRDRFKLMPWSGDRRKDRLKEYVAYSFREYDEFDLSQAEFFTFEPRHVIHCLGREDGIPQLPGLNLDPGKMRSAIVAANDVIVPDQIKSEIETEELKGVYFLETIILPDNSGETFAYGDIEYGDDQNSLYGGEDWYVLRSTIELSPVAPSMRLLDAKKKSVAPGAERENVRFIEPPFKRVELHYRRTDVERFPAFDLAETWERWTDSPVLVASKRFYEVCQQLSIDMDWAPVRIDED